jgi:hypothetical protein
MDKLGAIPWSASRSAAQCGSGRGPSTGCATRRIASALVREACDA